MINELDKIRQDLDAHILEDKERFEMVRKDQTTLLEMHMETQKIVLEMKQTLDSFLEFVKALSTGKKILLGVAMIVGAVVGTVVGIKTIISWFQ